MKGETRAPVIGLTGGIASGKSAIAQMLRSLGAMVISADKIAKEVLNQGTVAYQQVVQSFGKHIIQPTGEIDRKALADIIFVDETQRVRLNQIVHPAVIGEIGEQIDRGQSMNPPPPAIVVEVPLLFEAGMESMFDQIWVVWVDEETQVARLRAREGLDLDRAKQRIAAQMSLVKKRELADEVINNNGSLVDAGSQVELLWRRVIVEHNNRSTDCS